MTRILLPLCLISCSLSRHPVTWFDAPDANPRSLEEVLASPVDLEVETIVSAVWTSELGGLLDVKTAGIEDREVDIDLPIVRVRHPSHGTVFIDTGIDQAFFDGGRGPAKGLVRGFLKGIEPVVPFKQLLDEEEAVELVLLTHSHFDHVLGLPDVAEAIPVVMGPNELDTKDIRHVATGGTYKNLLENRSVLHEFNPAESIDLGGWEGAIDILGDGAIWALPTPGHTRGSVVYFLNQPEPVLVLGDVSHTCWGWENDVAPGTFSHNEKQAAESFHALRAWASQIDGLSVIAGHIDCTVSF